MAWFHYLQELYTLDTLDTRFTTPSRTSERPLPSSVSVDPAQPSLKKRDVNQEAAPSRWRTPEFGVYYLIFIVAVPWMFKVTYDISKETHPNYQKYSHLLSPGWIPGRKVDNSDAQYQSFRDNIPYLCLVAGLHLLTRRLYDRWWTLNRSKSSSSTSSSQESHLIHSPTAYPDRETVFNQRIKFDVIFSILLLFALHGFSALKIGLILGINFLIAKRIPRELVPAATWIFNIGILFANELNQGYKFTRIAELFLPSTSSLSDTNRNVAFSHSWAQWLDNHGGLASRWEVTFNITILRLISFNMDHYWSRSSGGPNLLEKKQIDPDRLCERERITIPARTEDYNFQNYLAYAIYAPLYLAGPIITFNDFLSQLRYPLSHLNNSRIIRYGVRWLLCLLCMELTLHYLYVVAISKSKPDWNAYTPFQLSMIGYFNLTIIWLKLLLPWRFFRLWALMDGVDPPENFVRCMSNNYSALAFWRGWHRSFNRWCIRYIYVPLGGSNVSGGGGGGGRGRMSRLRTIFNYALVFTFVAIWHDINLQLLIWGWLITLFILPEVVAGLLFPKRSWSAKPETYRVLSGIGAAGNILFMMTANLVGFAIGLDGTKGLMQGIVGSASGVVFLLAACTALFVGVQVMFEIREEEQRAGIKMKC